MIISLTARWIGYICCYLYPAYASYKALSIHPEISPVAQQQVERWLMYWAVIGTWTAVEAVIGWTFTWIPFYSVFKTIVLLYLSLPQSEGSSYLYRAHLAPFFEEHEADIDSFLASMRGRASTALAGGVGWAWEKVKAQLNVALPTASAQGEGMHAGQHQMAAGPMQQPPTLSDPASGAAQQLYGYFARYAGQYLPVAISALSAAAASTRGPAAQPQPIPRASSSSAAQGYAVGAQQVQGEIDMPIPVPTPPARPMSKSSDSSLRSRTYLHAQQSQSLGVSSSRLYPTAQSSHPRSVSTPTGPAGRLSTHNSDDSMGSHSSASGNAKWTAGGMSGYEEIRREEADGVAPSSGRPGMEKRRSSWFGWGGGGYQALPDHPKDE